MAELRQRWPQYVKGMPAMRLADQIDHGAIARVQLVEAELAEAKPTLVTQRFPERFR
jgi:hypothetical protein